MFALTHAHFNSQATFTGSGNTLNGRPVQTTSAKGKERATSASQSQADQKSWGTGQALGPRTPAPSHVPASFRGRSLGVAGTTASLPTKSQSKRRSPTPDWGVDDDDIIEIDSD